MEVLAGLGLIVIAVRGGGEGLATGASPVEILVGAPESAAGALGVLGSDEPGARGDPPLLVLLAAPASLARRLSRICPYLYKA